MDMYTKGVRPYGTGWVPTAPQMESPESNDMPPVATNTSASVIGPVPEPPDVSAMTITTEGRTRAPAEGGYLPPLVPAPSEATVAAAAGGSSNKLLFIGAVIVGVYLLAG